MYDEDAKLDHFDTLFKRFSNEHSWYKGVYNKKSGESNFKFMWWAGKWTMHSWATDNISDPYKSIIDRHPVRLNNGLLCAHYGGYRGVRIAFDDGGIEFVETLAKHNYQPATELLLAYKMNSCTRFRDLPSSLKEDDCVGDLYNLSWRKVCYMEYERMRKDARKAFYRMMSELYKQLQTEYVANKPLHMYGALVSLAQMYRTHALSVTEALETHLPNPIIGLIVLPYHHIYDVQDEA
jgi:hypothetical protein